MSHLENMSYVKKIPGLGSVISENCNFPPGLKSFLNYEKNQAEPSKLLKLVVENYDSRYQETSHMKNPATSSSIQDLYLEFRTRSGRHVRVAKRYDSPIDNSDNVSFVECFSCDKTPNSFEEDVKSEWGDEWLAVMAK